MVDNIPEYHVTGAKVTLTTAGKVNSSIFGGTHNASKEDQRAPNKRDFEIEIRTGFG
jgi:hypothetical protein